MTYKARFFFAVLFALLAGLAAICHNEGLLRVSLQGLEVVCEGTSEPASRSTPLWQPSPTQEPTQPTVEPLSATSTALLSAPFDTSTPMANGHYSRDPFSGFSNSSTEEHLTFICSSTSPYRNKLWRNGGLKSSEVAMTDTCLRELESKLCTMVAVEPSATPQNTPQS